MVQKLTELRFGISKFGIPIEIWRLMAAGIGCTFFYSSFETFSDFGKRLQNVLNVLRIFENEVEVQFWKLSTFMGLFYASL